MKLIIMSILSWISINYIYGQSKKISVKGKIPLLRGYYEYQEPINGIYVSRPKFITLSSDCDSVFSTESGTIIAVSKKPKDTSQKLIIKSGNLRLFYYGLKEVYVKSGDKIIAGQSIGSAKQITDKTYSIIIQIGDKKTVVWGREKQENYLNNKL